MTAAACPRRPNLPGSTNFRSYASINVANAVAAIEGYVAINYLLKHNIFPIIDVNHDGIITAQELQGFVDNSAQMGYAGSRIHGGPPGRHGDLHAPCSPASTTRSSTRTRISRRAEQRRFNFFNYAVDGMVTGGITINQYKELARVLLAVAGCLCDHRSSTGLGQWVLAGPDHSEELHRHPAHPALVPVGAAIGGQEVSQHLARSVPRRDGDNHREPTSRSTRCSHRPTPVRARRRHRANKW